KHKPTPELLTMRTPQRSQPFPYTTLFRSRKLDKHTWHAERCQGPLVVRYLVYAWDLSVRGAHLDRTHGYFNGTSVFLRAIGHERAACELEIDAPQHPDCLGWRVATTLESAGARAHGFCRYRAPDSDALLDHA